MSHMEWGPKSGINDLVILPVMHTALGGPRLLSGASSGTPASVRS